MTLVTVTNLSPVVTVTDSDRQITLTPPNDIHIDMGVNPPVYNLSGHSIYAVSGGLTAYQFVIIDPADGTAHCADGENPTHAGLAVGITAEGRAAGQPVTIQVAGEITNPLWDLYAGEIYYLAIAGTISRTPPSIGFWQKVGTAKNAATLIIRMGESILLV
jgi:hypothetical protein